jgi:hypothetical protein
MNLERANILLEKIQVLLKSLSMSPNNIAPIETDLMRSYIRQLYEIFLDEGHTALVPQATRPTGVAQKEETPKPVVVERKMTEQPQAEEPPVPMERVQERIRVQREKESAAPKISELPPALQEVTVEKKETPKPPVHTVEAMTSSEVSSELEELFEVSSAKELSEKLSQLPIPDLTKAFGLNEKIFTINELFGGDQKFFAEAVNRLNVMTSFAEAKSFLIGHVAGQYDWMSKDRKKKAKEFVKVVRRRYP